jgi:murein DD-endopeptidase MepM/ murein hydrolase activator NlpD
MRTIIPPIMAAALLLAGDQAGASAQAAPPLTLSATHRARTLGPGEIVVLRVVSSRAVNDVRGLAFDRPVLFSQTATPTEWVGLIGIDVEAAPGKYFATIKAITSDGERADVKYGLVIEPKTFATRRLTVDPAFVDPPAAELPRIQAETKRLAEVFAHSVSERQWRGGFGAPVAGPATSRYGELSEFNGQARGRHRGADFRATLGTPVKSPAGGRVALSADLYFSGGSVILDHGQGLFSHFAHLSSRDVEEGALIEAGHTIGRVGATGRATGPHLHWAVRIGPASVDPLSLLAVLTSQDAPDPPR